ncbi:MAG: glycosyltransferase family 2 protein [Acetobacteraceae bacterium]|nr:glycosyltransferase family 2 protein [Acetobacteraceae bacterium]
MYEGDYGCELGRYFPDSAGPKAQSQVAVVIPTMLRPCLETALRSVYAQEGVGRVQIMIGIDRPGDPATLYRVLEDRPANMSALVLTLPYSTSVRHGGPHTATDGGALRAILSFMANTRYVAYLDDDNTWFPDHLKNLLAAIEGKVWAFSRRILVDEETGRELAVDRWDSVGANKGRLAAIGGLVDPSCLLINKVVVARVLGRWSETADGSLSDAADRHFFAAIRNTPHGAVQQATVRYSIRRDNILHKIMAEGIEY